MRSDLFGPGGGVLECPNRLVISFFIATSVSASKIFIVVRSFLNRIIKVTVILYKIHAVHFYMVRRSLVPSEVLSVRIAYPKQNFE